METRREARRMYKSSTNRMVDGVCAGIAAYFGLDPTLVRIATVLLAIFGGVGLLLYIVAAIIMPRDTSPEAVTAPGSTSVRPRGDERLWGALFLIVGLIWLLRNLGVPFWHHWWGFPWEILVPALMILAGVAFLYGGRSYITTPSTTAGQGAGQMESSQRQDVGGIPRRMHRSRADKKVLGVCGGLGEYFGIDSTIIRLLFVLSAFASTGLTLLIYLLMGLVVPKERDAMPVT